ncbi:MAG: alpha/beta hydrolase [Rhodanobacteraceae bacterium]|nr:alpha/beta hydrolase [Rhodanobacteraceae bacterium]
MRLTLAAALACFAASASASAAGLPQVSVGRIERIEAMLSAFLPARNVDVWLPPGYPQQAPYAVIYMHDGQMLFDPFETWNHQEWRADEVAAEVIRTGRTRPFIIVGVWNDPAARISEYFPQRAFEALSPENQRALFALKRGEEPFFSRPVDSDNYLKFLVEELKPRIDRSYAVDGSRESTVIMGSSMGGLISMYALSEYPEVFGAAACLSTHWPGTVRPEIFGVGEVFFGYVDAHFPPPGPNRIYFDHGSESLDQHYAKLQQEVDRRLRARGYDATRMLSLSFPGTDHSEQAWGARLHVPMQFLLPPRG